MNADDLAYLAHVLHRRTGIQLADKKTSMIETRLAPVMRRFGFRDVCALLKELYYGHEALIQAVIEAMTTNDSAFFRDRRTFEEFRDIVLPNLIAERAETKQLRIWCAACAAGQEPYSIAMLLDDAGLIEKGWQITLIATDINSEMVGRASDGLYTQFDVQRGLPIRRLMQHFTQEEDKWRIAEKLRRMVTFRVFNLLDSYGWLPDCDVVFCRNVLMYFGLKTRLSVLDRIGEILAPDGALLVGPAESLVGYELDYVPADNAPGLFYKNRPVAMRRRNAS